MLKRKETNCKVCGKDLSTTYGCKGLCAKHYRQFKVHGKFLDSNPRTIWDDNEVRVYNDYAEVDTYTENGEILETYKLDVEDVKLLNGRKWRTVYKGALKSPYLVTGHAGKQGNNQVYFHRLITNAPNDVEIDHINRDSSDNRKSNLRFSDRNNQLVNTRLRSDNTQGIKGVYFIKRDNRFRAEISKENKHFYSIGFNSKEEACYCRLKLEELVYGKNNNMFNSEMLNDSVTKITESQKTSIDTYLINKLKDWV